MGLTGWWGRLEKGGKKKCKRRDKEEAKIAAKNAIMRKEKYKKVSFTKKYFSVFEESPGGKAPEKE